MVLCGTERWGLRVSGAAMQHGAAAADKEKEEEEEREGFREGQARQNHEFFLQVRKKKMWTFCVGSSGGLKT